MITYVINTSENKTLERDRGNAYHGNGGLLFDLAGYHHIRWIYSDLAHIGECADRIVEDQNKLTRDKIRIAIIIDFNTFDRVMIPYMSDDTKVQNGIYKDFLELYLYSKFYDPVSRQGCRPASCEVYYIQRKQDENRKPANYMEQVCRAFSLEEEALAHKTIQNLDGTVPDPESKLLTEEEKVTAKEMKAQLDQAKEVVKATHTEFSLHLTDKTEIVFSAREYTGENEASADSLVQALNFKLSSRSDILFRHYNTTVGGSAAAAYDNLALSLYLVKTYEKDNDRPTVSDSEIDSSVAAMDREELGNHLCTSYYKVRHARDRAYEAKAKYFPLEVFYAPDDQTEEEKEEFAPKKEPVKKETVANRAHGKKPDAQYRTVINLAAHKKEEKSSADLKEIGGIMKRFFTARDENNREKVLDRYEQMELEKRLTKQDIDLPRDAEYDELIRQREDEIQRELQIALSAEYVGQDYTEEKEAAEDAYGRYQSALIGMRHHILGDIALLFFTIFAMLIPYGALQLSEAPFSLPALICYGIAAGVFSGVMILSYALFLGPLQQKKAEALNDLCDAYNAALAKREKAFEKLKSRYDEELPHIETLRYEIWAIEHYRAKNKKTNDRIDKHRVMLEEVEVCLRSLLNNMNVYVDSRKKINSERDFDPEESLKSEVNAIYRVFSLEAIEKLFKKGGR